MQFIAAGPAISLWASVLLLIVLFACVRMGGLALKLMGLPNAIFTKNEFRLFSLSLGFILVSLAILGIGLLAALTSVNACIMLALFILLPSFFKKNTPLLWAQSERGAVKSNGWLNFFWLIVISVFFLSWVQAQMPSIGTDALAYHLFHPKEFVLHHKIYPMPPEFNRESLWPYQTEMLFTIGLLLQGTLLAQLFHWVFYILIAAAVFLFSERFFGRSIAYLSTLIFIFTPAAFAQSGHAYVDLSLSFYSFIAFYVVLVASDRKEVRTWFLAGLFAGGAASTKYLGLGCAAILFTGALFLSKFNWKASLLFFLGCFAAAGIWYLRSWILLGNPVFPFFPRLFHGNGYEFDISEGVSMGKDLKAFLWLPWNMTMYPQRFGGEMLGPFFLLFLPPFFFQLIKKNSKPLLGVAFFTVLYGGFLFTQSQHVRFFLSVVPAMSVGSAVALDRCLRNKGLLKRVALAAVVLILLTHLGIYIYRVRDCWDVATGRTSATEYLMSHERSFKGNDYLRSHMKNEDQLLYSAEVRYFYNDNKNVIWDCFPLRVVLAKNHRTMTQFLSEKHCNYVWLGDDSTAELWNFIEERGYKLVYYYQFTEKPVTFNNFIYRLERSPTVASRVH